MSATQNFFQATGKYADVSAELRRAQDTYEEALKKAQSEKVCSKSFEQTLDNLDSLAATLNSKGEEWVAQGKEVNAAYNDLGFIEKRTSTVTNQMLDVTNLARNVRTLQNNLVAQKPTRSELRQQFNSCQDLDEDENQEKKDAEEADKEADAAADAGETPKDAENQQSDDQTAGTGTNPTEPNSSGQKQETDQPAPTAPGASTPESGGSNNNELLKPNPLGKFSSYTYNLTLYMVTPEAYNLYLTNYEMPKTGVFIIAQSGGIDNASEARLLTLDTQPGPGKTGLDYFIDDIKLDTIYPGKHGQNTATTATNLNFKIYEPQGFGFLPRLANAAREVIKASAMLQQKKQKPLPFQMMYIMGIRFYGYDEKGDVVTAGSEKNTRHGNFERFFPLLVKSVRTKLDGRVITYDWQANVANERFAFSQMYGKLNSKASLEAATVEEAIGSLKVKNKTSLLGGLNAEQEEQKQTQRIEYVCEYDVEYEPGSGIPESKLLDDDEYNKAMAAMSAAKTMEDVTPQMALKSNSINTTKKKLEIPQGMSIVNVIDQLITKSTYITQSLNKVNNQRIETQTKDKSGAKELTWFAVHPKVEILNWDTKKKYWSIKITFQIKTYKIPYIRTQYADRISKYYGPVKVYNYWFTGGNSEVLSYEQSFNSLYYIIQPYSTNNDDEAEDELEGEVPNIPDSTPAGNDVVGKANGGSKINEAVRDSVYNEADQYKAQVRIIGDPDYLMETLGGPLEFNRVSSSQVFKQFYHKRGSINPYGGQIFCEIVFKVSEDYSEMGTGLQEINNDLSFYGNKKTQKILKNQGVIYQVIKVESIMRRGLFQQTLNLLIVPPKKLIVKTQAANSGDDSQNRAETAKLQRQQSNAGDGSYDRAENARFSRQGNANARQSPVQESKQETLPQEDPISGLPTTSTVQPLRDSTVSTPSSTGRTVANDDASANNTRTNVPQEGREEPSSPDPDPGFP